MTKTISHPKPYHWLTPESRTVLERGYLLEGETPQDAVRRVTTAAANRLNRPDLQPKFEALVANGWMSLSSPVWANMGTDRGFPISCFGSYVEDSMGGITETLSECIMMTKLGGGTSAYFGHLRERGASIRNNGKSSGPVSFLKMFDAMIDTVSQGNVRRGAFAAYLDIEHPDVTEFLKIKDIGNAIQNIFFGVTVSNQWMQKMVEGDKESGRSGPKCCTAVRKRACRISCSATTSMTKPPMCTKTKACASTIPTFAPKSHCRSRRTKASSAASLP